MKSNEIIAEGPLDYIKNTAKNLGQAVQSGGIQGFKQNQAVDRRNSNYEARLQKNVKIVAKKWDSKERSMPNRAALHNDPKAYYSELLKFLDKEIKAGQTGNLAIPDIISTTNTNDIITKFSQKAFPPTPVPGAAPAATDPVSGGFKVDLRNMPKPAAGKGFNVKLPQKVAAATPTTPKAGDPVPGMSGYVYTGKIGTNGKPQAIKLSPAAITAEPASAPSTLPTKAKSKTKAKDIDIDAALKMADSLSPEEKKKLLQDLLKSGVTVKAGGA